MVEIAVAERVVQHFALALRRLAGRADHMQHRHRFGVAARDGVERAELSHAVSGEKRANTGTARVAVGGVGGVELVSAADPGDARVGDDVIKKQQIIIAGHAKQVFNATSRQAIQQIVGNTVVVWHIRHPFSGACSEYRASVIAVQNAAAKSGGKQDLRAPGV